MVIQSTSTQTLAKCMGCLSDSFAGGSAVRVYHPHRQIARQQLSRAPRILSIRGARGSRSSRLEELVQCGQSI